ncbi:MAG: excinuclease ABC subunit UvrC [Planctomycetota bacterium]|nr:excinuclease ABC subunit UvrC [Planctomycetota bacterium]
MASEREKVLERLREKASALPTGAGVYLFKDSSGRVLYVGKAKNLRARVSSYFQPAADLASSRGPDIGRMITDVVAGIDILECDSEVDALLRENRLIKDIHPRFNKDLKDGKSYPYLQIRTAEPFPRVRITRQPMVKGVKLYGPFVAVADLRAAVPLLQRVFRFRTCKLDIAEDDEKQLSFRPCILHTIRQCSAPCAGRISRVDYRRDIANLRRFLESKGSTVARRLKKQMDQAAAATDFERAAMIRDQLRALEGLQKRGLVGEHPQPEVFYVDPAEGLARLTELLGRDSPTRTIEGIDIAHLGGGQTAGSLVCFIDGRPFKGGYRRYKIRTAEAGDDYAAIAEVVARRYKRAGMDEELFPDVILIDGGKGQLAAAREALDRLEATPPALLSLAKREELVHILGRSGAIRLKRNDPALRLLQSVRDEAHRFAQAYHHILRRKKTLGKPKPVRKHRKGS